MTVSRIHAPMASSTTLTRKHARQPHGRNASSGSWLAIAKAPRGEEQPAGHADVGEAAEEAPALGRRELDGQQHGAAVLAAHADALQHPQHHEQDRRPDADLVVRRQQADRGRADAHDHQGPDQHRLAADPVPEVAEDEPADRAGEEADGEGAERRELRGRPVEAVEEELVEDEAGGGAVEEEVVPLDGGADRGGERDPTGVAAHRDAARRGAGGRRAGGGGHGRGHVAPGE